MKAVFKKDLTRWGGVPISLDKGTWCKVHVGHEELSRIL